MSEFRRLIYSETYRKGNVLMLEKNDVSNVFFDENMIPEGVDKIILKSHKNIDFVVVLRTKQALITYEIASYTHGKILFIFEEEAVEAKREILLNEGVEVDLIVPDFYQENRLVNIETKLVGEGARANWYLSSFTLGEFKKKFVISFSHYAARTFADMQNYGVVLDQATLIFTGDSTIYENVKDSETHQTARIIVFDEGSLAKADPILNIYHNDVIAASHAATVGRVNSEHLYYLNTRGLTELEAKQLITKGYLMPILEHIDDQGLKENFSHLLEGVI